MECEKDKCRIFIAVDGDNFYRCMKDHLCWWVDSGKMKEYFEQFGQITRAIYYTSIYDDISDGRDKFHRVLVHMGYSIVQKKVKHILQRDGTIKDKASMDVIIARDICLDVNNYDMLVLVSGDGDFVPVLESLRTLGKQFKVISTNGIVSRDLREIAGIDYIDFEEIRSMVERSDMVGRAGMAERNEEAFQAG